MADELCRIGGHQPQVPPPSRKGQQRTDEQVHANTDYAHHYRGDRVLLRIEGKDEWQVDRREGKPRQVV